MNDSRASSLTRNATEVSLTAFSSSSVAILARR